MNVEHVIQIFYLVSSIMFILGLRGLNHPDTARRGMFLAEIGMALAIIGTLLDHEVIRYDWIIAGMIVGSLAGAAIAIWTPMTHMPQRTALSHAFGALAATLVGVAEFYTHGAELGTVKTAAIGLEVMLGALTFTGSMMAFAKLQELMRGAPITYPGQNVMNIGLLTAIVGMTVYLVINPAAGIVFYIMVVLAFLIQPVRAFQFMQLCRGLSRH